MDADGNLVASPFGSGQDALPLSPGRVWLPTPGGQHGWWEDRPLSATSPFLIYTRPVVPGEWLDLDSNRPDGLASRPSCTRACKPRRLTLIGAGSLTTLAAFGIGWLLSGLSLRPIHRITRTARDIGDERDFTRRVEYQGPADEVGQLATTFNSYACPPGRGRPDKLPIR